MSLPAIINEDGAYNWSFVDGRVELTLGTLPELFLSTLIVISIYVLCIKNACRLLDRHPVSVTNAIHTVKMNFGRNKSERYHEAKIEAESAQDLDIKVKVITNFKKQKSKHKILWSLIMCNYRCIRDN